MNDVTKVRWVTEENDGEGRVALVVTDDYVMVASLDDEDESGVDERAFMFRAVSSRAVAEKLVAKLVAENPAGLTFRTLELEGFEYGG